MNEWPPKLGDWISKLWCDILFYLFYSECVVNSDTQDLYKQDSLCWQPIMLHLIFEEHQWDLTDHEYLFWLFQISKTNSNSNILGKLHINQHIFITFSKQDLNKSCGSLTVSQAVKLGSHHEIGQGHEVMGHRTLSFHRTLRVRRMSPAWTRQAKWSTVKWSPG